MHLSELKAKHVSELLEMANTIEIEGANRMRKHELIFALLKARPERAKAFSATACLKCCRTASASCARRTRRTSPAPTTSTSRPSQIRRFNLHTGDTIEGEIRTPKEGERYFALVKVDKVNGEPPEAAKNKILFENLTPLFPNEPLVLERDIKARKTSPAA